MSKYRLCGFVLLACLFGLTSISAWTYCLPDPCKQARTNLARQMQELKERQRLELAQCQGTNGRDSVLCGDLKERQKEEMRQAQERQRMSLRGCNEPFAFNDFANRHEFHESSYISNYNNDYYPPDYRKRHHYHDHDGDGDHHHHHHHGNDANNDHNHYHGPGNSGVANSYGSAQPRHDAGSH